jgi:Cu/Ag efflux protein CusF
MKRVLIFLTVILLGFSLVAIVMAEEKATPQTTKPSGIKENTVTVKGTVQAIDLSKRVVTLKGPKGDIFDLKVGEEAKNLPQLKVGDEVTIKYYESLAYEVTKPGQAGGAAAGTAVARAKPGEKPGGLAANMITATASVEAIDAKKKHVTLKGPEGKTMVVKVKDPKNLVNVKVGDQVMLTYTEALAVSVEPAKKK